MRLIQKLNQIKHILSAEAVFLLGFFALPASALAAVPGTQELKDNPIVRDIQMFVDFLAAGVGIVVVGVIIVGGIQYMTSGDNPTALTAAKQRITNGLIALAAFLFTFAFLQWLIPGGIF